MSEKAHGTMCGSQDGSELKPATKRWFVLNF